MTFYTAYLYDTMQLEMKWKILPKKSDDLLEQLLINRGIKTEKDKEQFFHPKLYYFEDYLNIPGIEKAQKRILQAIKNGEQIIIYGDYDVDGICGSAILYKALTSLGAKVLPYIPHREKEGYGLSKLGLEFARDCGATLLITVDNGIVAIKQAEYAKKLGLDLIITDHHLPLNEKPPAYAIVHSTKMCGAAVAWCLIRRLIKKELAHELLQFVAMATVCDLLPLVNLGRAYVSEGFKVLNKDLLRSRSENSIALARRTLPFSNEKRRTTNLGLRALIKEAGLEGRPIGSYEVGHILGPRLNAMGRLEHAMDSLRLLCTKDPKKARNLAKLLSETNTARQQMTTDAIEQAKLLIDHKSKIHILSSHQWSPGIIGLIAGRITEEYLRPTIAISLGETISKGSARSIDGVNIVELIRKHGDLLIDVGGHPKAAGFSIATKNITLFKKRLEEITITLPDQVEQILGIDAKLDAKKLSKKLIDDLKKFEPFGLGNPRPIFATYNMEVSDVRTVGEGKHLKFQVDGIDAIAFGMGDLKDILVQGQTVDLAYTPQIDDFNGYEKIQLKVKDMHYS